MNEKPAAFRKRAGLIFFTHHGEKREDSWIAKCQVCGRPMTKEQADAMHKQHAGMGGPTRVNNLENIIMGHGHRCGPYNCHSVIDRARARLQILIASPINVLTGGVVDWKGEWPDIKKELSKSYTFNKPQ